MFCVVNYIYVIDYIYSQLYFYILATNYLKIKQQ